MLLFANKARAALTGSVTSAAGQVAAVTTGAGALFVGVGGVATSSDNPMRCVMTAVDANGNDTGAFEVVEVVRAVDNLTLQSRGLEGTSASAWGAGTIIECRPTADVARRFQRVLTSAQDVDTSNTSGSDTAANIVTIPANMLKPGDVIQVRLGWRHSGALVAAVRVGCYLNGTTGSALATVTPLATNETTAFTVVELLVGSGTSGFSEGYSVRQNGTLSGAAPREVVLDTTVSNTIDAGYRGAAGETLQLVSATITIVSK